MGAKYSKAKESGLQSNLLIFLGVVVGAFGLWLIISTIL